MKKLLFLWLLATAQLGVPSLTTTVVVTSIQVVASTSEVHAQVTVRGTMAQYTPSLVLDFTKGVLPSGVGFSRSSVGTYFDASGVLQTASSNVPRFDYDPVTHLSKGLLIEEARTNRLTYSTTFSSIWQVNDLTVTASAATSPSGIMDAVRLVEGTANSFHRIYQLQGGASASTSSIYVKSAGRQWVSLRHINSSSYAFFDIINGVFGNVSGYTATIQPVGNGWFRITSYSSSGADNYVFALCNVNGTGSDVGYTGDGTSGVYIWGAQLEAGSFATSYIPTTSAAVTRAQEYGGLAFGSWYNPNEGTLFVDCLSTNTATAYEVFGIGGSGNAKLMPIENNNSIAIYNAAATKIWSATVPGIGNARARTALAYTSTSAIGARSGTLYNSQTGLTVPVMTYVTLWSSAFYGNLYKVMYYPRRLPNPYLQALTN